jgi:hypothetical protein
MDSGLSGSARATIGTVATRLGSALLMAGLAASAASAAPAPDLVGKSVLLTWTESRQQSVDGSKVHPATVEFDLRIYVSGAGRPFTRLTSTGRHGPGTNEQVGGAGKSLGGGVRTVRADGHTITLQAVYGNYARTLNIDVSGDGCSAHMTVGKQLGAGPKAYTKVNGITIVVYSLTAGQPSCTVRQGNVFTR